MAFLREVSEFLYAWSYYWKEDLYTGNIVLLV